MLRGGLFQTGVVRGGLIVTLKWFLIANMSLYSWLYAGKAHF